MAQSLYLRAHQVSELEQAIAEVQGEARKVMNIRKQIEDTGEAAGFLATRRAASPLAIELLADVTRLLPDDTYLDRLVIGQDNVQMQGKSRNAQQLIERVNESQLLSSGRVSRLDPPGRAQRTGDFRAECHGSHAGGRLMALVAQPGRQPTHRDPDPGDPAAGGLPDLLPLVHPAAPRIQRGNRTICPGQLGRYQRVAAQRTEYETLLQGLQDRKSDENLFLEGSDFNEAAAGMSERLSQMIGIQAEDSCQIVSRQPVRPRVQERFEKVTVNVRMRCGIEDLKKVLYALETGVPMVIADEVTIIKPRARRRRSNDPRAGSRPAAGHPFQHVGLPEGVRVIRWLDDNPVGQALAVLAGGLAVVMLLLAVVWSLPPDCGRGGTRRR